MLVRFVGLVFFFLAVLFTSGFARPGSNEGEATEVQADAVPLSISIPEEPVIDVTKVDKETNTEGERVEPAAAVGTPAPVIVPIDTETTPVSDVSQAARVESVNPVSDADANIQGGGEAIPKKDDADSIEEVFKYSNPIDAAMALFSGNTTDANERAHAAWELARRSLAELHKIEQLLTESKTQAHIEADITSSALGDATTDVATDKDEGEKGTADNDGADTGSKKKVRRKSSSRRSARVSIS